MRNSLLLFMICLGMHMQHAHAQDSLRAGLVDINGTQLYIKTIGQGDTILVIHGGPGLNHAYLLPHFAALAETHTIIFYDQRSSGKSQLCVKAQMNFSTFADDIEAIRKHFGIKKLNIMAHSWGALLAAHYILNYPEQVNSLVLISPVPFNKTLAEKSNIEAQRRSTPADSARKAEILQSSSFRAGDVEPIEELMLLSFKILFCDTTQLSKLDPALPPTYMVASMSMYGFVQEMANYDMFPRMKDIPIPTLIIRGACDISPEEADIQLQQRFTDATLVIMKDAGHFPFVEENKKWTKEVNTFYKGLTK